MPAVNPPLMASTIKPDINHLLCPSDTELSDKQGHTLYEPGATATPPPSKVTQAAEEGVVFSWIIQTH